MAAAAVGVHLLALEVEAARERGSGCSGGCLHHSPLPSSSALEEEHSAADPALPPPPPKVAVATGHPVGAWEVCGPGAYLVEEAQAPSQRVTVTFALHPL